ncbi:MAG: Gfo/Idh/MocA family oxidoreductase, partial [Verrucomicrobiota bacterium]
MGENTNQRGPALRIGIVGFGSRANEHLDALELNPLAIRICFVSDPDPGAQKLARERFRGISVGDDLPALLAENPCDLVVVCLPPDIDLTEIAKALSECADLKAVLLEKPAANSSEMAANSLKALSVPVFLFHQMRFLPWIPAAREWYQKRSVGAESAVSIETFCYGKFLDQGLHVLDLACLFAGGLPDRVTRVLAEADPARISAQNPLPFDWRLDDSHAGPTLLELEAEWSDGKKYSLKTGPDASRGWLDKQVRIRFGEGDWIQIGAIGLTLCENGIEQNLHEGTIDDYLIATASV